MVRTLTTFAVIALLTVGCVVPAHTDGLTADQIRMLNQMSPAAARVGLGTKLNEALLGTAAPTVLTYPLFFSGNCGHDAGVASDGVLFGALTDTAMGYAYLFGQAEACKAYADDGGAYTDETTGANEATGDDVTLVPATAAQEDAYYIGHSTDKFGRTDITITTQGNFVGTVTWEYWNGTAWAALAGVTDGTSNFSAAAATVSVTFTVPEAWAQCTVDSVLAYWIRGRLSAVTSGGGATAGRIYCIVEAASGTWTDDTTDYNDDGAGDVALLPAFPVENDAMYLGADAQFCKLKTTVSQARVAGDIAIEYSKAAGAWGTLTCDDNSAAWTTGAATYITSFVPPADWVAQEVNSQSAYWIRFRLSSEGVTTQPLATQGWIKDFTHGDGIAVKGAVTFDRWQGSAATASAENADSKFLIINLTDGTYDDWTWTAADIMDTAAISLAFDDGEKFAIVQVQEDGTTEFALANFILDAE